MLPLTLYRNRLIPMESVLLKHDRIIFYDHHTLITGWKTLKPKNTLASGYSCYLIDQGFKISRFYDHDGNFMHWYCDIIDTAYDKSTHTYVFTDLLVDVELHPDGTTRILDLDELSDAVSCGLINTNQLTMALSRLHNLLQIIYNDEFDDLVKPLLIYESIDRNTHF